jgi:hypothetical protein
MLVTIFATHSVLCVCCAGTSGDGGGSGLGLSGGDEESPTAGYVPSFGSRTMGAAIQSELDGWMIERLPVW